MAKIPTKTFVALLAFTLCEAFALKFAVIAPLHLTKTSIFPNNTVFYLFVAAATLVPAYFIGKLLIQKWRARPWIKALVAVGTVLASYLVSYYLVTIADRYYFWHYIINK